MGMLLVGIAATGFKFGSLRNWVIAGCLGSALTLAGLSFIGTASLGDLLQPTVILLGFCNGMFAVAAIGSMMSLAGEGRERREGTRMGLWGAAQAIAAGFGGLTGAALVDIARTQTTDAAAFGSVFIFEACLFVVAAILATKVMDRAPIRTSLVAGE
jgi:BCD family chlorophyll transporter-like MFS transporter